MMNKPTSKRIVISVAVVCIALALLPATKRVSANNFIVTTLNDSGLGSLRQAILDANANPGADTIIFQAGLTGTITLTTGQLPIITENLTINGPGVAVVTVSGNHASGVLEINSGVTVTISDLAIGNGFVFLGGSILNNGGIVNIANSTLSGSSSSAGGGVANILGTVTITNSTFSGNTATGGGVFNLDGTVNIINSTISNNSAAGGGGIFNQDGTVNIINSTISNNSATLGGFAMGGAIFTNSGTVNIANSTLSGNLASNGGGGIRVIGGMVNIKNSIVVNSIGGDCSVASPGTLNALGANFSTDSSCPGFTVVTATQLNLGPLALNPPGTTATHALLSGSVAIDAVTDCTDVNGNPVPTDQRGVARPLDGDGDGVSRCDVGAYEAPPLVSFGDLCIQDESNGSILNINSITGDYQFVNCSDLTLTGTGSLIKKGSTITLQHYSADRRVLARIDTSVSKATASIQVFSQGMTFTIIDRNISNNTCSCIAR